MVTRRTARKKGNSFEYDCQYSLSKICPDIILTKERGFQRQYDLKSDESGLVFECKNKQNLSWNALLKIFKKLRDVCGSREMPYLLFKSNRQPCLVFYYDFGDERYIISTFEDYFEVPFLKHPSTKPKKVKK